MCYKSRAIRMWPIVMVMLLLVGFILSESSPPHVAAQALFQSVDQNIFSFNHVLVRFTPPADSCADQVKVQLSDGATDIDITIYDEIIPLEGQRFNTTDKLAQILDRFSETAGPASFPLPSPLRLTADDDVYIAISTQPHALSADEGASETTTLSYISYDGASWRESQLAFNIQLQTATCGPDIPAGPVPTNTPFVPTPTATPLPTSTPVPTVAPDEPTYTPTATVAVQAVCEAPSMRRMQVATDPYLEEEENTRPLWSELLASERFSSHRLREQSLLDFYRTHFSDMLEAAPAKLEIAAQVDPNITGTLLLPDGNPAAHFSVSIYEVDSEDKVFGDPVFTGQTDGTGVVASYLINGRYLLRVEPPLKDAGGLPIDGIKKLEHLFDVDSGAELGQLMLPATTKVIQGQIVHIDGKLISETRVDAFNVSTGQYVYTYPDSNGAFVLNVGGGLWQLSLLPVVGVEWVPVDIRLDVQFQQDETAETRDDLNFAVRPADAIMTGRVVDPSGQPLASDTLEIFGLNFNTRFDLFDTETERSAFGFLDATGAFTIPLASGIYEGSVWIDNALYPEFTGTFLDNLVQVTTGAVDVGLIRLAANDSVVRGTVRDSDGVAVPNVPIELWQDSGPSRSGTTDGDGIYDVAVPSGEWWVKPAPQSYQTQLFTDRPQLVTLDATAPTQANFSLEPSAGHLSGTVVDEQDQLLSDVDGYVYIRRDGDTRPAVSVRVENGRFTVKIPYGDLRVGLFLGPDSPYLLPEEAAPEISTASVLAIANLDDLLNLSLAGRDQAAFVQNAATDRSIKLQVVAANAQVQGLLQKRDGTLVTGIAGDVIAIEQGNPQNWKRSAINPADGSYRLNLVTGIWDLVYELEVNENDKTILPNPEQPVTVIAEADTTVTQNLEVTRMVLVAKGTVVDENDRAVSNASVLLLLEDYEGNVRSDENGLFQVYIPASLEEEFQAAATDKSRRQAAGGSSRRGSSGRPLRKFTLPSDLPSKIVVIEVDDAATGDVPEMKVVLRTSNTYLTGQVLGLDQKPVEGAKVSGVNQKDAQVFSIFTDANGCFNAPVKADGEYEWLITARYQDGDGIMMESQFTMTGEATNSQLQSASVNPLAMASLPVDSGIAMQYRGAIPQPEVHTFLVKSGWSHTLPDGFTIEIAPNAVNTTDSEVRIQLMPRSMLNETYMHSVAGYGYQIALSDSNGRAILSEFRSNVLITLDYEEAGIANEEGLIVARASNDQWLKEGRAFHNEEKNFFSVSIQKPGVYAVVQTNAIPELSPAFPLSSLAPAKLTGDVESSTQSVAPGGQAVWTLHITNTGGLSAQNVILIAQLPSDTQIAESSLADGWTEQETGAYHLTLDPLEGGESASMDFAVTLSANSALTTILEPRFVLQNRASGGNINISTGLGNNIDVSPAPTASDEEEGHEQETHQIYLPVIAQ